MEDSEVGRWIDNANKGIAEGKPQFVLASSNNLQKLGRRDLVEKVLRDGYEVFNDNLQIFRALATLIRERSPNEAIAFSEEAISRFGNNARFQKALALANLGRRPEAIAQIESLLQDDATLKHDRFVVTKLFDLYNDEGAFQKARELLEPLIDAGVFPDVRMRQLLATVLNKLRQSPPKVLDLLRNDVDPQSERLKQHAREIVGEIAASTSEVSEELRGRKIFFAYAIKRKDLVLNLARHLERELGVETMLMDEESHEGRSLVEKFEELVATCGFGVFVLTADDEYVSVTDEGERRAKVPRQNVILELGYLLGKLGRRKRIAILVEQNVTIPSDLRGLGWISITKDLGETKLQLVQEVKSSDLAV